MARSSSGNSHRNSDSGLPFDIERRVNEAWEAYNEKCKECEALRDEVAKVKQNSQNSDVSFFFGKIFYGSVLQ